MGKGRAGAGKVPKKLGPYVIERKLGAGAMGVVYLGRDPILERQVAIKVLPASLSRDEERLKRFLREAKSAARLHHTNVAAVHQAGAEGRLAYIAMEYVEGKSLDKAVDESKPMNWREATRVIRDAAAGLAAAHAIDLVHRDIKPANLIRTTDGVTKVVDFGLARGQQTNTQLTQQGTLLGTPAYMAPEQWGGGVVDGRTDLYALTCTYYCLLTGRVPFDAPSLPALGYQHRYEPFPDPRKVVPGIPDELCWVLIRGSAKDAAERFQTAEELASELDMIAACPDETLHFGSPWTDLVGAPAAVLPPEDDPLGTDSSPLGTLASTTTFSKPTRKAVVGNRVPRWAWFAIGGWAVLLLSLLSIGAMVLATKWRAVQIAVDDGDDNIQAVLPAPPKLNAYDISMSSDNLEQIGLAMHLYHDTHRSFPPAARVDPDGNPLLSWRVQLLPYLEERRLHDEFHLDEPWDSDHNKKLIERMPRIYRNPGLPEVDFKTNYLAVSGEGTAFFGEQGTDLRRFIDGSSNTIIVVEANADLAVTWTKPDDFPFNPEQPMTGLGDFLPDGFQALFADGSVQTIPESIDPWGLRAMMTIAGGEPTILGEF